MDKFSAIVNSLILINFREGQKISKISEIVKEANKMLIDGNLTQDQTKTLLYALGDYSFGEKQPGKLLNGDEDYYSRKIARINGFTLNLGQKSTYDAIMSPESYSISMPTSFGKSFIVRAATYELVKNGDARVIIVVPTLALLAEYVNAFEGTDHSTNPSFKSDIMILTQERANFFNFKKRDYVIMDEAYESFDDNQRSVLTVKVMQEALSENAIVKLISPNLADPNIIIPKTLSHNFKSHVLNTTLTSREIHGFIGDKNMVSINSIIESSSKEEKFLLYEAKGKMYKNAEKISIKTPVSHPLIDGYLSREYSKHFLLVKLLKKGIGIHNADIPKDIRVITELLFKNNILKILIANTTIVQGVNLRSKNMIINSKATRGSFTKFLQRNLLGRVGRYSEKISNRHGVVYVNDNIQGISLSSFQDLNKVQLMEYVKPPSTAVEAKRISKLKKEDGTFSDGFKVKAMTEYWFDNTGDIVAGMSKIFKIVENGPLFRLENIDEISKVLYAILLELGKTGLNYSKYHWSSPDNIEHYLEKIIKNFNSFTTVSISLESLIESIPEEKITDKLFIEKYNNEIKFKNLDNSQKSFLLLTRVLTENKKKNFIRDVLFPKLNLLISEHLGVSYDLDDELNEKMKDMKKKMIPEAFARSSNSLNKDEIASLRQLQKIDEK